MINRLISIFLIFTFIASDVSVYAQSVLALPSPGTRVSLIPVSQPLLLKGIKVYSKEPFRFDFILERGDDASDRVLPPDPPSQSLAASGKASVSGVTRSDASTSADADRLIKYFLAALTIPEKDLWVNLSPYEKDRIVPDAFGKTEMGRDLLAQDYILKQITASLMYPEGDVGKKFWSKVYAALQDKYGTTDIPVDTFNKVWIVPEKAEVYEHNQSAYVTRAHLKVMLETDYIAMQHDAVGALHATPLQPNSSHELTEYILRETIIPILEKEVNEGDNFAQLRQVYYSLILATWYKRKMMNALPTRGHVPAGYVSPSTLPSELALDMKATQVANRMPNNPMQYYIDHQKTAGVDISDKNEKKKIWSQYVAAFKNGLFNYIHDDVDQNAPRQYFSGGADFAMSNTLNVTLLSNIPDVSLNRALLYQVKVDPFMDKSVLEDGEESDPDRDPLQDKIDQAMMDGLNSPDKGRRLAARVDAVLNAKYTHTKTKEYKALLLLGVKILNGYMHYRTREGWHDYLSSRGHQVAGSFESMLARVERKGFKWGADVYSEYKDLMRLMPTVSQIQDDLFIDVVPFLDSFQVDFFPSIKKLLFDIRVSDGCTNQCAFCMVSKDKGAVMSMPLPVAVKIQKMLRLKAAPPQFYFNTEPLDYYDPVVGADYADLVMWERKLRFSSYREFTHGLGGKLSSYTKDIIKQLPVAKFGVSLRVDHWSVINFFKEMYAKHLSLDEARRDVRWQGLVRQHVNRFLPLVEGALESKRAVLLRVYDLKSERKLKPYVKAWYVLSGMQELAEEVLRIVKTELAKKEEALEKAFELSSLMQERVGFVDISDPVGVIWKGDAAKFLVDLGVPIDAIRRVAWAHGTETILSEEDSAWGFIGADGHAYFVNSEEKSPSLLVRELFPGPSSRKFELLVNFLKDFLPLSFHDDTFSFIHPNLKKAIKEILNTSRSPSMDLKGAQIDHKKVGVNVIQQTYWRLWQSVYIDNDRRKLIQSSDDLGRIYEAIKDFPVPRELLISVADENVQLRVEIALDESISTWEMDPRVPIKYFKSPLKVFEARPVGGGGANADSAQLISGRVMKTGVLISLISVLSVLFVYRDEYLMHEDVVLPPSLDYGKLGVNAADVGMEMLLKKFNVAKSEVVLIVDPQNQEIFVVQDGRIIKTYPVSTSIKGIGVQKGSDKTPDGIFKVYEKIGAGAKKNKWFINKMPDKRTPGADVDAVLSRILVLDGQEVENANSLQRAIYIHGTNHEDAIGRPASHGCIRMRNDDVIELFDLVPAGSWVVTVNPQKLKASTQSEHVKVDRAQKARNDAAMRVGESFTSQEIINLSRRLFPETKDFFDYLAQFKGQSGREGEGYHSYEHGLHVTYLTYLALSAQGYSRENLLQTWMATSLHDFDRRAEMAPPRVDRTIAQIQDDSVLKEKIQDVIGEDGLRAVLAIIRRTDHPWKADQVALFNQAMNEVSTENNASVSRRAEIVQLIDKLSGFVYFDPQAHYKSTQALLIETGREFQTDIDLGKFEVGFMNELLAEPQFNTVLDALPDWARKNWGANRDFYTRISQGVSVISALPDHAMSLRVKNEDEVRRLIESARLKSLGVSGTSFKDVLVDSNPASSLSGYVIKVPIIPDEEGLMVWAKEAMGGIVADFNTVSDVEIGGVKYPFVVVQKKFKVFDALRLTDIGDYTLPDGRRVDLGLLEKNLIEEMMARGILYPDGLVPKNYGLDEKTGKLYLVDYGRALVVGRDHHLFNEYIFKSVNAKDFIRKVPSVWRSYQDRDDGKYFDDIGVADNDALYQLWGTKMNENRPVPDIELSSDKGSEVFKQSDEKFGGRQDFAQSEKYLKAFVAALANDPTAEFNKAPDRKALGGYWNDFHHGPRHAADLLLNAINLSSALYKESQVDWQVMSAAIALHDVFAYETIDHGPKAISYAKEFLKGKLRQDQMDKVLKAIELHDVYSEEGAKARQKAGFEAQILFDVDQLDAFGHKGIYRYIAVYAQRGETLESIIEKVPANAAKRWEYLTFEASKRKAKDEYEYLVRFFRKYGLPKFQTEIGLIIRFLMDFHWIAPNAFKRKAEEEILSAKEGLSLKQKSVDSIRKFFSELEMAVTRKSIVTKELGGYLIPRPVQASMAKGESQPVDQGKDRLSRFSNDQLKAYILSMLNQKMKSEADLNKRSMYGDVIVSVKSFFSQQGGSFSGYRLSLELLAKYMGVPGIEKIIKRLAGSQLVVVGAFEELYHASLLEKEGFELMAFSVVMDKGERYPFAEIDVVARKDADYYFIEIKHMKELDGINAELALKKSRVFSVASRFKHVFNEIKKNGYGCPFGVSLQEAMGAVAFNDFHGRLKTPSYEPKVLLSISLVPDRNSSFDIQAYMKAVVVQQKLLAAFKQVGIKLTVAARWFAHAGQVTDKKIVSVDGKVKENTFDHAMSLRVRNEDEVRRWIESAQLVGVDSDGSSFEEVFEDAKPGSSLSGFVIKVPIEGEREENMWAAKQNMGGFLADFNTVHDVEINGVWHPFVVIQRKLKVFNRYFRLAHIKNYYLPDGREVDLVSQEKQLLEAMVAAGIYYADAFVAPNYGLDEKTGRLYFVDYGRAKVVRRDSRLFKGNIFTPVNLRYFHREDGGEWQFYHDRDEGAYFDQIGLMGNDDLYSLWGTRINKNSPVPDIQLPFDKGGIDLNPSGMDIKSSGDPVSLNFDAVQFESVKRADGLVPVILDVKPISNINQFMQ